MQHATQTAPAPAVKLPQSEYYAGFDACFFGKPLDKSQSESWQRGWRAALAAEADANTPRLAA